MKFTQSSLTKAATKPACASNIAAIHLTMSYLTSPLVPKLQLGNSNPEALASCLAKLELRFLGSQAGAWEPAT
jgi:hypothetical protein